VKQALIAPAEYGDTRLAPTTELAGLAELATLTDFSDQLAALVRIAEDIRIEDLTRRFVDERRAAANAGRVALPRRHRV
jgi:hypothetical protein